MKNAFYSMLKAVFVLKLTFGHIGKRPDNKAKFNLKIYDVTDWIKHAIQIFPISQEVKAISQ